MRKGGEMDERKSRRNEERTGEVERDRQAWHEKGGGMKRESTRK